MRTHAEALAILQGKGSTLPSSAPPATARRRAAPLLPTYATVDAVIIGVDPGSRCSGWAIRVRERLIGFGEVHRLDPVEIDKVIAAAERFAELAGAARADGSALPVVLIVEKPPPANVVFKGRTPDAVAAVFAARGAWLNAWQRAGYPPRRAVGVQVQTWRAAMIGRAGVGGANRASITDIEALLAATHVRASRLDGVPGPDACPAILISGWGVRAALVHKALEPRKRAAAKGKGFTR